MKNIVLSEINRMREIMGHSKLLVEVDRSKIAGFVEDIFTHGGDDTIRNMAREVDQELEDALIVLNNKKTGMSPVTDNQVDNALEILVKKIDANDIAKTMISKNLLPQNLTNDIDKIKDFARNKKISAIQYDAQIDKYVDKSFAGLDDEIRNAFKNEFKKQIPTETKAVKTLTKDVLEELETKYPELFKTQIFGLVKKNPKAVKSLEKQIIDGWKNSGKTKEQIIKDVRKEADELESLIRRNNILKQDEKSILQLFIENWKKGAVGLLLGYVTFQLVKNWITTGSPLSSIVKTGAEELKKTGKVILNPDETKPEEKPAKPSSGEGRVNKL